MDLLLNRFIWYLILGGVTVVALIVFVIQQKRKIGSVAGPRVEALNGTGTRLLFFQKMEDGTYVATVWVIVIHLPIFPLSTWRVMPLGVRSRQFGGSLLTEYNVSFMERKPMGLGRVAFMYCEIFFHVAVIFGPLALVITLLVVAPDWAKRHTKLGVMLVTATSISGFG